MQRSQVSLGLVVWITMFVSVGADGPGKNEPKSAKDPKKFESAFERFRKLAGDWKSADANDKASAQSIMFRYRVTACGSAVVETVLPGCDEEMVTVYYRDGDAIALTHFCCFGNQPRMRAKVGDAKDELTFNFAGGTNIDPQKDKHMHSYRVRFVDEDHLTGTWEYDVDGKAAGNHAFDLVRVK